MDLSWILLALFLVAMIRGVIKSLSRSALKNTMRLGSVIAAFSITLVLQIYGVFQGIVELILDALSDFFTFEELLGDFAGATDVVVALVSTVASIFLFVPAFFIILFILRIIVHYVANAIDRAAEKKAQAQKMAELKDEKSKPAKKKKVKKKKNRFYPERACKRLISFSTGAISGTLVLAILLMPIFYVMSIVSTATDAVEDSDATDSQIYQMLDIADEYVVDPYKRSFVYSFYDAIAIDDALTYAIKTGGKITLDDGSEVYADDVLKGILAHGVSAAMQLTSQSSECKDVGDDVKAIVTDPAVSGIIADVLLSIIADLEIEEPAEDDLMGGIINNFTSSYKDADKATIEKDLAALGEAVGVLAEKRILAALISGEGSAEAILEDEQALSDTVAAISGLSAFGPTIEGAFNLGIEVLGDTLMIPSDDATAYDIFVNDILDCMVKSENVKFDANTIKNYVYRCATEGKRVASTNGIPGHSMFISYVKHWQSVQSAFAHASEDTSYGYFTIEINGKWYVYDTDNKSIVEYTSANEDTYKDKISPLAGIINALALKSTTGRLTVDNLNTILNAYVASSNDSASVELAYEIMSPDTFKTKTVTVEKMMAAASFTDWTDEEKDSDSRLCVEIIMDLLDLMDSLGNMENAEGTEAALDFVDHFGSLGATMDIMKKTSCINGLPELLIEALVKHEILSTYMKPATVHEINSLVENNNKSYAECMNQLAVNIKWAINSFGGEQ